MLLLFNSQKGSEILEKTVVYEVLWNWRETCLVIKHVMRVLEHVLVMECIDHFVSMTRKFDEIMHYSNMPWTEGGQLHGSKMVLLASKLLIVVSFSVIIRLRQRFQATGLVQERQRYGRPRFTTPPRVDGFSQGQDTRYNDNCKRHWAAASQGHQIDVANEQSRHGPDRAYIARGRTSDSTVSSPTY